MGLLKRNKALDLLKEKLAYSPAVAILGPRQCGKTTLVKQFIKTIPNKEINFFDLEDPRDLARLENPILSLEDLSGYVVIDEIQRKPELFPILRVLIDKQKNNTKYILLGSASRDILESSSETLAGRISYLELEGFGIDVIKKSETNKLWLRGGFPRSFLAASDSESFAWREDFISTFLERDVPNLGIRVPATTLRRFWTMLAHYHGEILNYSDLASSFGVADTTIRHYIDILVSTFLIRELKPWHQNTKKRLVKRPKIYFRDSGLFHSLSFIKSNRDLQLHPKLGQSWEAFAIEQSIYSLNLKQEEAFFWKLHSGAEMDLVFERKGSLYGVEVKYNDAPTMTKSIASAIEELDLEQVWIVYPGSKNYRIHEKVEVISINQIHTLN